MNGRDKRSLEWWLLMGSVPSLAYFAALLIVSILSGSGIFGGLFMFYIVGMPVFALAWLLIVAKDDPIIHFDHGSSMSRGSYVLRFLLAHFVIWAVASMLGIRSMFGSGFH